jgi:hypothetical protein
MGCVGDLVDRIVEKVDEPREWQGEPLIDLSMKKGRLSTVPTGTGTS